jgi:two-component system sensor histidine kinase/response regulator
LKQSEPIPKKRKKEIRAKPAKRLNVLLVEDNRVNQRLAVALVEKVGHRVTVVENGSEALKFVAEHQIDVVLMDIQMPVMGGVETTQMIRSREQGSGKHLPIIAMTAHAMEGDAEKYLASGMDGYVSKPIRPEHLRAEIERVALAKSEIEISEGARFGVKRTDTLVDFAELSGRVEGDNELLSEMVTIFREEFPRYQEELCKAIDSKDGTRIAEVAHTLKGMLANLSARRAADLAGRIEQLGRKERIAECRAAFAEFREFAKRLSKQLAVHIAEGAPCES